MNTLRFPAIPLITSDPYLNIWSMNDCLYDDVTRHWTGRRHNLIGIIKIDKKAYRFMGRADHDGSVGRDYHVIPQISVNVYPMRTVYNFENDIAKLELTFMSPLLADDLKILSRPVSYIGYNISFKDGNKHDFKIYFGMNCETAVNSPKEEVTIRKYSNGVCAGRGEKDILSSSGDNHCTSWGWMHIFSDSSFIPSVKDRSDIYNLGYDCWVLNEILGHGKISGDTFRTDETFVYIGAEKEETQINESCGFICVAYDDIHSIQYFGKNIDAYYKKDGDTFDDICRKAINEYKEIIEKVSAAEEKLISEASKISGKYAQIISLAYRQAIAAHKLTWHENEIQFFSKECFSNGCIATLDVTYPSFPMFLKLNPELCEGMLNPLFKFAYSDKWEFEFAPHDVGQYPLANGQVYGLDEETGKLKYDMQMPVEECGNAILCVYQLCHYRNDFSYAKKHIDILRKWCKYLIENGSDPDNQLCTDDFAGHLAHNCNLSVKAIMGIAAFSKILEKLSLPEADKYFDKAKEMAADWEIRAKDNGHYRLAFDKENSWSLKYNLVWDIIFKWNIFNPEIVKEEVAYYKKQIKAYGAPLDSRSDYTKSDWLMWTTCLTDDIEYRDMIIDSIYNMLNETVDRVPFTDWYFASTAIQRGFQNRTVQGGLFINMI